MLSLFMIARMDGEEKTFRAQCLLHRAPLGLAAGRTPLCGSRSAEGRNDFKGLTGFPFEEDDSDEETRDEELPRGHESSSSAPARQLRRDVNGMQLEGAAGLAETFKGRHSSYL